MTRKITEARNRANKKWLNKNKGRQAKYTAKSQAKRYLRDYIETEEELQEIEELLEEAKKRIRKN